MIIDPSRIQAGDHQQALEYILAVGNDAKHENEEVTLLEGYAEGLAFHCATSKDAFPSKKYTLRHWKINPEEFTSPEDLQSICHDLMDEFGVGDRPFVIALHTTNHADGPRITHAHLMVAELDSKGKVLSNKNNAAREHKIARRWEKKLGHNILSSRYDAAIAENEPDLADDLQPKNVVYKYTQGQFQKAQKLGIDLNEIHKSIEAIRAGEHDIKDIVRTLSSFGVSLGKGKKDGILVLEKDGTFLTPLHKAGAFHADEMTIYYQHYIKNEELNNGFEQIEPQELNRADNRADTEQSKFSGENGEILEGQSISDETTDRRHSPSSDGPRDEPRRDADGLAHADDRVVDDGSIGAERSEQSIEENAVRAEQQADRRTEQKHETNRGIKVGVQFLNALRLRVRDFAFVRKLNDTFKRNKSLISAFRETIKNRGIGAEKYTEIAHLSRPRNIEINTTSRLSERRLDEMKALVRRADDLLKDKPQMPLHERIEFIKHSDEIKRHNDEMHRMLHDVQQREEQGPQTPDIEDYDEPQQPRFM